VTPEERVAWDAMNACCDEGDSDAYRWSFAHWAEIATRTRAASVQTTLNNEIARDGQIINNAHCVCGHPAYEHFRDHNACMFATETETWACDCTEFTNEGS
jgi:hypothetical protein